MSKEKKDTSKTSKKEESKKVEKVQDRKGTEVSLKTENEKKAESKYEVEEQPSLSQMIFLKKDEQKIEKIEESIKDKRDNKKKASVPQKVIFKTSEEVLDAHFSYLENMLGKEGRDEFKSELPVGFMLAVKSVTDEQKREYRRLIKERREEVKAFTKNQDHFYNSEEYQSHKEKRDIINENYVPVIFNLLTEQQQKELSLFLKENFFEKIKHRYKK